MAISGPLGEGTVNDTNTNKRPLGTRWCSIGSTLTGIGLVLVGIGLLGARLDITSPINTFLIFGLGMFAILVSVPTLVIGLSISYGRAGAFSAWRARSALLVSVALIIAGGMNFANREPVPPIHDLTTDVNNPPEFVALIEIRTADEAKNPPEYPGEETATLQQEAFPDLVTLQLDADPATVFKAAGEVIRELGWDIAAEVQATGRLEATDTTTWFRFRDDVVVRIQPGNGGTSVDVRSKSRVGRGDMGTNAARIREFLARLQTKLS